MFGFFSPRRAFLQCKIEKMAPDPNAPMPHLKMGCEVSISELDFSEDDDDAAKASLPPKTTPTSRRRKRD